MRLSDIQFIRFQDRYSDQNLDQDLRTGPRDTHIILDIHVRKTTQLNLWMTRNTRICEQLLLMTFMNEVLQGIFLFSAAEQARCNQGPIIFKGMYQSILASWDGYYHDVILIY